MTRAIRALSVVLGCAPIAACGDPFGLRATLPTVTDTVSLYAMSGTSPALPAGFSLVSGDVARITPELAFDVAFDLSSDGRVRVLPVRQISPTRLVLGAPSPTHQVGLQASSVTFESLTQAPRGGYVADSVLVVPVGQVVVIESRSETCSFSLSPVIYGKVVIDSIDAGSRKLFMRTTRNPNCGFRSFQPGVPRN